MSIEVLVSIFGDSVTSGPLTVVSDDPNESFLSALSRAYNETTPEQAGDRTFDVGLLNWGEDGIAYTHGEETIEQVSAAFPFVAQDPVGLSVTVDGLGGDGVVRTLEVLIELYGAYDIGRRIHAKVWDEIHHRQHKAAEDWLRTGEVSDELRQLVYAEREWDEDLFLHAFDLTLGDAARLLKGLRYESEKREDRLFWVDKSES
ncbi:MAG TPA: hypothetical protein VGM70_10590 [Pseudolysinimonas sp.]|jgi:hypothetical protein